MVPICFTLYLIAVILQSSAKQNDNYVVDNGFYPYNLITPNYAIGPHYQSYNFYDFYKMVSYQGQQDRVTIQLYYECLCPDCRNFDSTQFKETVGKLGPYLDVNVYPYGNAQTEERGGHVRFICQHGPPECYGNKLHACAIDYLKNMTAAIFYNSCMMDESQAGEGSDDKAADVCGYSMGINTDPIKQCAKSDRGSQLLKYYGEESKKANFQSVPYITINGVKNSGDHFMQDVCKAFKNLPPACQDFIQ